MSTGYSWEGIRQVRATLLGARHVPERLCGGYVYLGRYIKCSTFTFTFEKLKFCICADGTGWKGGDRMKVCGDAWWGWK